MLIAKIVICLVMLNVGIVMIFVHDNFTAGQVWLVGSMIIALMTINKR